MGFIQHKKQMMKTQNTTDDIIQQDLEILGNHHLNLVDNEPDTFMI